MQSSTSTPHKSGRLSAESRAWLITVCRQGERPNWAFEMKLMKHSVHKLHWQRNALNTYGRTSVSGFFSLDERLVEIFEFCPTKVKKARVGKCNGRTFGGASVVLLLCTTNGVLRTSYVVHSFHFDFDHPAHSHVGVYSGGRIRPIETIIWRRLGHHSLLMTHSGMGHSAHCTEQQPHFSKSTSER